jgi:predicted O-methyltransferase YrrM
VPTRRAIRYPTNRLLAVVDDPTEAAAASAELAAAGVATRDLEILRGDEGADRMDGTGEVSGWLGRLRRAFDFTLMDQLVDFAVYERALRDGRAVVMVHVHGDAPKVAAQRILKSHGGHFINYYGRFATEELDLWRGPEPEIPGYLRR